MSEEGFHLFLGAMCATALFVFIALYFIKAGYGMFRTASWGYSINNKLAWVLMEAPVFIVMFWRGWLFCAGVSFLPVVSVALLSEVVCLSFSAEREEPDAGSHYGYGHCVQRPERNDAGRRFVLFCS